MTVIVERNLNDKPRNISIDWPIFSLKNEPRFSIDRLFKGFGIESTIIEEDGLGHRRTVLFEAPSSKRWFYAHDSLNPEGVIFETSGKTDVELFEATAELMDIFRLQDDDLSWISEFVQTGQIHRNQGEALPGFREVSEHA